MSIVRVGTTKKYAEGWEGIFGKKSASSKPAGKKSGKKSVKKAPRKKK